MAHAARARRACGDAHTTEPAHAPENRSGRAEVYPVPTAHFMAFFGAAAFLAALFTTFIAFIAAAFLASIFIAFIGAAAFLAFLFTTFIAFIAAARIAFAMTRSEVSTTPMKRQKAAEMRS